MERRRGIGLLGEEERSGGLEGGEEVRRRGRQCVR